MLEDKLGVEYGYSVLTAAGIAKNYRYLGSRCVKFSDVAWGDIQPTGPITIFFWTYRSYNWSKLDAAVKDWQQFGYDIHMVLRSKNSWATQATVYPPAGMPYSSAASCPPKAQYWTEYSEFIKQVVLRYSGVGGNKSMPGLVKGIKYWEIESEQGSPMFWQGTDEEYIRLLENATTTIKSIDPSAKVILGGLNFSNMFNDNPSDVVIEQRLSSVAEPYQTMCRNGINQFYKLLDRPQLFDIIEFHNLLEYTSVQHVISYLKREMNKRNYMKDIWVGDANSAPQVQSSVMDFIPLDPYALKMGQILPFPNDPRYPQAVAWVRAEQAKLAIKKYTCALAYGAEKIMMGLMEDWPWYAAFPYNGMTESDGTPRPVWYAMQTYISKVLGAGMLIEVATGSPNDKVFRFTTTSGVGYIAWNDSMEGSITLPLSKSTAIVWQVPTTAAEGTGKTTPVSTQNGMVTVKINSTPVIIS
jgi:hypothetical protein